LFFLTLPRKVGEDDEANDAECAKKGFVHGVTFNVERILLTDNSPRHTTTTPISPFYKE
jgi:hypothetical protein